MMIDFKDVRLNEKEKCLCEVVKKVECMYVVKMECSEVVLNEKDTESSKRETFRWWIVENSRILKCLG